MVRLFGDRYRIRWEDLTLVELRALCRAAKLPATFDRDEMTEQLKAT